MKGDEQREGCEYEYEDVDEDGKRVYGEGERCIKSEPLTCNLPVEYVITVAMYARTTDHLACHSPFKQHLNHGLEMNGRLIAPPGRGGAHNPSPNTDENHSQELHDLQDSWDV